MAKKSNVIIIILILVIIILACVLLYFFVIRPQFFGYVFQKQIEAQNIVISNMLMQLQQTGYVQINVGNQSLILVPYQGGQQIQQL